jgi:hypothetical protein
LGRPLQLVLSLFDVSRGLFEVAPDLLLLAALVLLLPPGCFAPLPLDFLLPSDLFGQALGLLNQAFLLLMIHANQDGLPWRTGGDSISLHVHRAFAKLDVAGLAWC